MNSIQTKHILVIGGPSPAVPMEGVDRIPCDAEGILGCKDIGEYDFSIFWPNETAFKPKTPRPPPIAEVPSRARASGKGVPRTASPLPSQPGVAAARLNGSDRATYHEAIQHLQKSILDALETGHKCLLVLQSLEDNRGLLDWLMHGLEWTGSTLLPRIHPKASLQSARIARLLMDACDGWDLELIDGWSWQTDGDPWGEHLWQKLTGVRGTGRSGTYWSEEPASIEQVVIDRQKKTRAILFRHGDGWVFTMPVPRGIKCLLEALAKLAPAHCCPSHEPKIQRYLTLLDLAEKIAGPMLLDASHNLYSPKNIVTALEQSVTRKEVASALSYGNADNLKRAFNALLKSAPLDTEQKEFYVEAKACFMSLEA